MRFLAAVIVSALFSTAALAQALPANVANAYRAYEAAVDAEDWDEAALQAELAWRSAESGGVDPETVTVLAANAGEVALISGNHEAAAEAYERAADLAGELGAGAGEVGRYSVFAARANRSAGDYRNAIALSETAIELFSSLPDGETRYGGLYQANAVAAYAANALEQYRRSGRFAQAGLEAMRYFGPVSTPDVALLAYLAAIQARREGQREDALYLIVVSRMIAGNLEMDPEFRTNSYDMQVAIMASTSPAYFDDVFDRLRASGYTPERCFYSSDCPRDPATVEENVQNGVPLLRAPPVYPSRAFDYDEEGYVDLRFNVDADGRVRDVEVVEATSNLFVQPSLTAVRHWRYWPRRENGVDVPREGVETRIEFIIADDEDIDP